MCFFPNENAAKILNGINIAKIDFYNAFEFFKNDPTKFQSFKLFSM